MRGFRHSHGFGGLDVAHRPLCCSLASASSGVITVALRVPPRVTAVLQFLIQHAAIW